MSATVLRAIHLGMIDAVLAGEGPERVAALAARELDGTVVIALPGAGVLVCAPDPRDPRAEAVRRHVADPRVPRPQAVAADAPIHSGSELLGAVALLGERDADGHVQDVLHLAALAVRTAITLEQTSAEDPPRSRSGLLRDLRQAPALDAAELLTRARRLGCDLSRGAVALRARPRDGAAQRAVAIVLEQAPTALVHAEGGDLTALLAGAADALRPARRLERLGVAAVSRFEPRPERLRAALREADIALELAAAGDADLAAAAAPAWRLLIRTAAIAPEELDAVADAAIGALPELLVDTIAIYLRHGASMRETAVAAFSHRHTVAARLDRIHELTGHDPRHPAGQEALSLGLKAHLVRKAARASDRAPADATAPARLAA
jgi:hypothetical protein